MTKKHLVLTLGIYWHLTMRNCLFSLMLLYFNINRNTNIKALNQCHMDRAGQKNASSPGMTAKSLPVIRLFRSPKYRERRYWS